MVDYQPKKLDAVFHALANPARRNIVMQLVLGDLNVNQLAAKHDMTLQAVSKHIHVLVRSGLVEQTKLGRIRKCRLNIESLAAVSDLVEECRQTWEKRLDRLEEYFDKKQARRKKKWGKTK